MANPISSSMFLRFPLSISLHIFFLILCSLKEGHALERIVTTESSHHTLQISSLLPSSVCSPSTKGPSKKALLKVVHRNGPCSQLNSAVPTHSQFLANDQSRVNSIQSRLAFNSGKQSLQDSQARLQAKPGFSLGTGNYIVTVRLGTPQKELSLVFDTGSDLTWTQCQPCVGSCYEQQDPIFDPSLSTSYANITCTSPLCSQLKSATGNAPACSSSTCVYGIQYGDSSFSVGYFGQEKLTLTPTDVFSNFLFGCGQDNQGHFGGIAGLLGLGSDKLSLVSQTSQKYGKYFSYCLPSKSSSGGHLTFGKSGVSSSVKFIPFANSQGTSFYFIDITAIYVAGTKLSVSSTVFSTVGTIIDSGTVITRLPPEAYTSLRTAFRKLMTKYPMAQPIEVLDTCYDLSNYTSISIPKISFLFNGNVQLDLIPSGILYLVSPSQVCLAFAGNSYASDVGIFGNVQQQTVEVVYDVAGGKLGFGPGGCA